MLLKKNPTIRGGCGAYDFRYLDTRYPPCLLVRRRASGDSERRSSPWRAEIARVMFIRRIMLQGKFDVNRRKFSYLCY